MCHTRAVAQRGHFICVHHNSISSFHSPGVVWRGRWPLTPDLETRAGAQAAFSLSTKGQWWLFPTHPLRTFTTNPEHPDRLTRTVTCTGLSVFAHAQSQDVVHRRRPPPDISVHSLPSVPASRTSASAGRSGGSSIRLGFGHLL